MPRFARVFLTALALATALAGAARPARAAGAEECRVAKWPGDAKACFMLMFDDSWPSHFQVAAPELAKRRMTATFYICPAKGEYKTQAKNWEGDKAIWKLGFAYGNHTMTHDGIQNAKDAEYEISGCTEKIKSIVPGPQKRLVSWGRPGVKDWKISKEETQALLERNHLVDRPTFDNHGIVYHLKTPQSIIDLADKAIKEGGMEYAIAHGVERPKEINWGYQDFWAWKLNEFREVLDALAARRDRNDLWIADHVSYHQYVQERAAAKAEIVKKSAKEIQVRLTLAGLDPELYDLPLTVVVKAPAGWKKALVTQGKETTEIAPANGELRLPVRPGKEPAVVAPLP